MPGTTRLTRGDVAPAPPGRIAHLGLGAFARAHQASYTHRANRLAPQDEWGIVGFTGRRPAAAATLSAQEGLYHLVTRGGSRDTAELISCVVGAHDGAQLSVLGRTIASLTTSLVTITVSERGYHLDSDGGLDRRSDAVARDCAVLRALLSRTDTALHSELDSASLLTMPARLLLGLEMRRRRDAGPITVVPCDNIRANGTVTRSLLLELSADVWPEPSDWISTSVSFVDTSVDRITPATTAADRVRVQALTGMQDAAPVITEPFTDWVLSGEFPAGRPDWQLVGARVVDDVTPFELRKLWLLNAAHSLLAYGGLIAGYHTVDEAIDNDRLLTWTVELWDCAARLLPLPSDDIAPYCAQLLERFRNRRIKHQLSQIATDATAKLRERIVPVILETRRRNEDTMPAVRAVAAWIGWLLMKPERLADTVAADLVQARDAASRESPEPLLTMVDPRLVADSGLVAQTRFAIEEMLSL